MRVWFSILLRKLFKVLLLFHCLDDKPHIIMLPPAVGARGALSNAAMRPSVSPSILAQQRTFYGYDYYRTLSGNPMLEVELYGR